MPSPSPATRKRILVVDDQRIVTDTLAPTLAKMMTDVRVDAVGSAAEALERMERERYDLVLADYDMPGMDGIELFQAMRERHPAVKRVMVTAHGRQSVRQLAQEAGDVDAFITKPYSLKRMVRTLWGVLEPAQPPGPVEPAG